MKTRSVRIVYWALIAAISIFLTAAGGSAEEKKDMQGWGIDDPYNQLYNVREFEKIRVWVIRVKEVIPMPGMSPATAVEVKEYLNSEPFDVHLCPTWYRKPSEIMVKKNDRVKLKGAWAEINGEDVFMASKIKKDPDLEIVKVRLTKDGTPFWTMTPERLAKEMSQENQQ
jgi:hypothetical protein